METLIAELQQRGAALVGFADLSPVPEEVRQGFPRGLVIGVALDPAIIADIRTGPTPAYFDEYTRTNALLNELADRAADLLTQPGFRAAPLTATGGLSMATLSAPFQHKTSARLAGLGWIGKCALLVNPDYGAAVRWNTVLTEAALPPAAGPLEPRCGDCQVCLDVCPGHAAGRLWQDGMAREDFWDARACVEGLKRVATERGVTPTVCGICVANCPYTLAYLHRAGQVEADQ